jgi:hypothetical protein
MELFKIDFSMTKSEQKKHDEILKTCKKFKKIYNKIFNLFILCLQFAFDFKNIKNKKSFNKKFLEIIEQYIKKNFNDYEEKNIYKYLNIISFINYYGFFLDDREKFNTYLNDIKLTFSFLCMDEKNIYCKDFKEWDNEHEYIKNNNFYKKMIRDNKKNIYKYLDTEPEQQKKIINNILNDSINEPQAKPKTKKNIIII